MLMQRISSCDFVCCCYRGEIKDAQANPQKGCPLVALEAGKLLVD